MVVELYDNVVAIVVLDELVNEKTIDVEVTGSLNVAVTVVAGETPVAPATGVWAVTVGICDVVKVHVTGAAIELLLLSTALVMVAV